jgi:hypothetical protein
VFAPVLRALLVTEYAARWLHHDLGTGVAGTSTAGGPPEDPPWTKISGRELSRHLTQIPATWRSIGKEPVASRANKA